MLTGYYVCWLQLNIQFLITVRRSVFSCPGPRKFEIRLLSSTVEYLVETCRALASLRKNVNNYISLGSRSRLMEHCRQLQYIVITKQYLLAEFTIISFVVILLFLFFSSSRPGNAEVRSGTVLRAVERNANEFGKTRKPTTSIRLRGSNLSVENGFKNATNYR